MYKHLFFIIPGDVVLFEPFNHDEKNVTFRLSDFHKKLRNPLNRDEELLLIGIVRYLDMIGSEKTRSKLISESISRGPDGHYTAVAYRRGNTSWIEIDDTQTKQIPRGQNFKVVPRLLMYVKNSKKKAYI